MTTLCAVTCARFSQTALGLHHDCQCNVLVLFHPVDLCLTSHSKIAWLVDTWELTLGGLELISSQFTIPFVSAESTHGLSSFPIWSFQSTAWRRVGFSYHGSSEYPLTSVSN